ncbi:MAG: helix-turn-helix domain-containing protein [Rhizobacter sp.]|nr:helix-turn-helix domain-containing protein [Rhizobacter sp.]
MPATAPLLQHAASARLGQLGADIRTYRKGLRVSAQAAAEAAGMSRVTWHRIERGEPSVTMGAYLNALEALGLALQVAPPGNQPADTATAAAVVPERIALADYPQLQRLAWHAPGLTELTPVEALSLYERNWRHLDAQQLDAKERQLLDALVQQQGGGHLLV